jgi:hypothetical protein
MSDHIRAIPASAGCQPAALGYQASAISMKMIRRDGDGAEDRRQAADNCRLAACASQQMSI